MLRRRTNSGQSAKKMKPWKYEELMSSLLVDLTPRETQSNVDVADYSDENEVSSEPVAEENINRNDNEPELETLTSETGRKKANGKKTKIIENDAQVDKVITFLHNKEKNKKQMGELEFFFASACESTKCLPRHLQLRVKQDVMKAVISAEMDALNPSRPPSKPSGMFAQNLLFTPSITHSSNPLPAYSHISTPSPACTYISTPSPACTYISTPSPAYLTDLSHNYNGPSTSTTHYVPNRMQPHNSTIEYPCAEFDNTCTNAK